RDLARPDRPRRRGAFRDCLGHGGARRHPDQSRHGAGARRPAYQRRNRRGCKGRVEHHGCDRARHRGRPRAPPQHLRHADRASRIGASRQRDHAGILPEVAGAPITLQRLLGLVMAPVCWLMGIPWDEAAAAGALMGIKTVLHEFIAYVELSKLPPETLDARSRLIMLYAMCGFANFGSLGIMIAGLSTMAPQRRDDVLSLGLKSILSGTLATCLMGAIVGVLT